MATIDIRRAHNFDKPTAKEKAESLAKAMHEKLNLEYRWDGDSIRFEADKGPAKGVKGTVAVNERDVHVAVDLPFLLRALKGKIESRITEKLDEVMA
ncbi:MAG: polyhydroxyalkanoic acid system family protein [Nannocystaceae bacterium]